MSKPIAAPARVYLHPDAATSIIALRAIQHVTGRIATIDPTDNRVRLVTPSEHAALCAVPAEVAS